jgi:hypothetical protein
LISYLKTAMDKRLLISESHGDSNRCTPCRGKPDTHDTYTSRASPRMPYVCFLLVVHVRGNLSQVIISVGRTLLLLRKRTPDITPSPAEWSAGLPSSFSPNTAIKVVMKVKHLLTNKLHQFTRPITPVCDRYLQYLLGGVNPSVLNWHRRGLQPWRCQLSTYPSLTFPIDGLHLPPKCLARPLV